MTTPNTNCHVCQLHDNGHIDQAAHIEATRQVRLLLAYMTGSTDTIGEIRDELGGCLTCIARLASSYMVQNADLLTAIHGSTEAAIQFVQQETLNYLDQTENH